MLCKRHFDRKHRPLARRRADIDRMAEEMAQALDNGEAKAEPSAPFARRVVELVELVEDGAELGVGNADPGVPDLDAQPAAATTAAEQHLAALGVLDRVRQEVPEHLLEQ